MQNNHHEHEYEQDEPNSEVDAELDDEFKPKVARAIAYLKARIQSKQKEHDDISRQMPQSHSFEDTYKVFVHIFQMLILQNSIKNAQRNIQKLESPMYQDIESLMESVLHEQHTEQQVEMTNMMIDTILDHWLLTPLRLLLPQVVKDDISKLIVGIGSLFGSGDTTSFKADVEDEERHQYAPNY